MSSNRPTILGVITAAYYTYIPVEIADQVPDRLPPDFIEIIGRFDEAYSSP
jgi:hypothetical protein